MLKLAPMLAQTLASDIGTSLKRKRRNLILYVLAGLMLLTAYVVSIGAAIIYLSNTSNLLSALGIVALFALSVALLIIATILVLNWYEKRKSQENSSAQILAMSSALAIAPRLISSLKLPTVALTIIGAYLAYSNINQSEETKSNH